MTKRYETYSMVIGQLKELLHDFNLPLIPVYTNEMKLYDETTDSNLLNALENKLFIKDSYVVMYKNNEFIKLYPYAYNSEILNLTRKFIIKSSAYDQYTHDYFGDYLRFMRDYNKVDLMSYYNCFNFNQPAVIEDSVKVVVEDDDMFRHVEKDDSIEIAPGWTVNGHISLRNSRYTKSFVLDTSDSNYVYYIVPVKFNKNYTIAIDSETNYELACILYDNSYVSNDEQHSLIKNSYKNVNGSRFNSPFIYNTYVSDYKNLADKECNLKLLLKLNKNVTSSIVILEGNYTNSASVIDGNLTTDVFRQYDNFNCSSITSKLSLFEHNTEKSYPFADRLVEYILGNVITPNDDIGENIQRVQDIVYDGIRGFYGIWDDTLRSFIYDEYLKDNKLFGKNKKYTNELNEGSIVNNELVWDDNKFTLTKRFIDSYNDINGFVDKDTESLLEAIKNVDDSEGTN